MDKEREEILKAYFDVTIPLISKDQRECERNELMRAITAKNAGFLDCSIDELRARTQVASYAA